MIYPITRTISGSYDAANNAIVFPSNPYLQPNNTLTLYFTNNDSRFATTVSSVSGNNAIVTFSDKSLNGQPVTAVTQYFGTGISGPQPAFDFKLSTPPNAIIQASSTNGGNSSFYLEASLDQKNWIQLLNFNVNPNTANSVFSTITSPWAYGRLNFTSIDVNTSITITTSI